MLIVDTLRYIKTFFLDIGFLLTTCLASSPQILHLVRDDKSEVSVTERYVGIFIRFLFIMMDMVV